MYGKQPYLFFPECREGPHVHCPKRMVNRSRDEKRGLLTVRVATVTISCGCKCHLIPQWRVQDQPMQEVA